MTLYTDSSYSPQAPFTLPIERIKSYATETANIFKNSAKKYEHNTKDVRYRVFFDISHTSELYHIFCTLMDESTENTSWWQEKQQQGVYKNAFDNRLVKNLNYALRSFLKFAHFHAVFMYIEDALRKVLRELYPKACKNGTDNFGNIYPFLINKVKIDRDYKNLLELFSIIRNSIHNNGFYFPINRQYKTIGYKGKSYRFNSGDEIRADAFGYVDFYDFAVYLYQEINKMLNDLFNSPSVRVISSTIS